MLYYLEIDVALIFYDFAPRRMQNCCSEMSANC
jgi:hypothetical protein